MNIKRVHYKVKQNDEWKVGYIIGKYDGDSRTLLDSNFNYVPKIIYKGKEYLAYDYRHDMDIELNMTIPID